MFAVFWVLPKHTQDGGERYGRALPLHGCCEIAAGNHAALVARKRENTLAGSAGDCGHRRSPDILYHTACRQCYDGLARPAG